MKTNRILCRLHKSNENKNESKRFSENVNHFQSALFRTFSLGYVPKGIVQHIQLGIVVFLWHIRKEPGGGLVQQSYRGMLSMAYSEHRHPGG